jgi:hypothetical protein
MKTPSVLPTKRMDQNTWHATEYLMANHVENHSTRIETLQTSLDAASTRQKPSNRAI